MKGGRFHEPRHSKDYQSYHDDPQSVTSREPKYDVARHREDYQGSRDHPRSVTNREPRHHVLHHPEDYQSSHDDPQSVTSREPLLIPASPLEEEVRQQYLEVKRIFAENRLIIKKNIQLHRELSDTKDEMHRLGKVMSTLHAEGGARQRDFIEREATLEADLSASMTSKTEIVQLRAECQKLDSARQELCMQIQGLTKVVNRFKADNQKIVSMRTDIDRLKKELVEARKDCEYEKNFAEEQVEQKQAVESNLEFMAREREELRAEQLDAERRVRNPGVGRYERLNGSHEMKYLGGAFGDDYASGWRHYEKHGHSQR